MANNAPGSSRAVETQLAVEQAYVSGLYHRLDELRDHTRRRLDRVRRDGPSGTPQNRSERDSFAVLYSDRLAQLDAVEDRLCFGRLDLDLDQSAATGRAEASEATARRRYIGRLGLTDAAQEPLLIDWRAPAAVPFYQATAAHPMGVSRRRHITTRGRGVVALEDDLLDLDSVSDGGASLAGEGALLAAMAQERTGRMADIVATIQAEQDRIIRAPSRGALVVQGGPGTGKTAVALHRAAYLLYTERRRLASSGILVIGPSRTFLAYIDQVLPSLGETGVVATTMASLLPGFTASAPEAPEVAAIKGRAVMARVVRRAVRNRQRLPARDGMVRVLGREVPLRVADVVAARAAARASHRPYNQARAVFVRHMVGLLADRLGAVLGIEDSEERAELADEVRASRDVRVAVNLSWMPMTPLKLVGELYAKGHLLAAAAPELSPAERAALRRDPGAPWTVADVPLLDEAAELLGEDDASAVAERRAAAEAREREIAYASRVLATHGIQTLKAEQLADRWAETGPALTVAERAAADRAWAYGHIVVDEAQELSPMDWRCLLRRCPTRSLTIVGDVGQTRSPAGARQSWEQVLDGALGKGQWRLERLTVNYRTPASVMARAEARARASGLPITPTTAARYLPDAYGEVAAPAGEVVATSLRVAEDLAGLAPRPAPGIPPQAAAGSPARQSRPAGGRIALIAAPESVETLRRAVEASPLAALASGSTILDSRLAVLTPAESKGLEFDDVVLLSPHQIAREAAGPRDLYVAMTRPTRRLRLVL